MRADESERSGLWRPGVRIDRYELMHQIGAGGMGVVWSARDVNLDRHVAVKLMRSPGWSRADLGIRVLVDERALSEARAMARLSHPNVVTIHDVGVTDEGAFIAMEWMEGGTLAEWLRSAPRSWPEVVAKFIGAGRGLAEAHRAGLVHRDFKPDNVLLGRDDVARVSDFGLALAAGDSVDLDQAETDGREGTLTQEGALAGTLVYMAPEQLLGHHVDARSDQFSFCVALYEALYGVRPFGDPSGDAPAAFLLAAILERRFGAPAVNRRAPGRLKQIAVRGLACDPEARWPSMEALVVELERCCEAGRPRSWFANAGVVVIAAFTVALGSLCRQMAWCRAGAEVQGRGWAPVFRRASFHVAASPGPS